MADGILATLLALAPLQSAALEGRPADPLHHRVELELAEQAVELEIATDFDGGLHVWVESEGLDPRLTLVRATAGEPPEEHDSEAGAAAYLEVEVRVGERWIALVRSPAAEGAVPARLHWVAAPETEDTRAAAGGARALAQEAGAHETAGELDAARELLAEAATALRTADPAGRSPGIARAAWDLGFATYRLGAVESTSELWSVTRAHRERTLPADHADLIAVRSNLAVLEDAMGHLSTARALKEDVLASYERTLPEDHPNLLAARQNLAVTLKQLGELAQARVLEESVLEASERLLGEDQPGLILARSNLAVTMFRMGDLTGARALFETVLEARERLLPGDHADVLAARQNLAAVLKELGDLAGARALEEAVLEARTRLLPEDHPSLLAARQNLAGTLKRMGDLSGALALEQVVLAARERVLPADHPDLLLARQNLAGTLSYLGEHERARGLFEAVRETLERRATADRTALLAVQLNLAVNAMERGEPDVAGRFLADFSSGMLRQLESISALSPRAARAAAGAAAHQLSLTALVSESVEFESTDAVFTLVETWRHATSVPLPTGLDLDPEVQAGRAEVLELRKRLNDLVAGGTWSGRSPDELADEVRRLAFERDRRERRLRQHLGARGALARPIRAAELGAALERNAAAVGYRVLPGWRRDERTQRLVSDGERVLAHVVRADGTLRRLDLGDAHALEGLVRAWRASLGLGDGRGVGLVETGSGSERELAAALAQRLVAPVVALLSDECTRLHLCADDFLYLVPIDALPFEGGCVGDRWTVVSEMSFGRLLERRPASDGGPTLLALGAAAFGAPVSNLSADAWSFPSLEHTLPEVRATAALFEAELGGEAVLLTGVEATKARFHELAPGQRYLHLATHGWFAPESVPSQLDGRARGGPWDPVAALDALETVSGLAPATLCGLAFAGAGRERDGRGRAPGLLTAEELAGVDLSACELAVLSACETNGGIRRAGQGLQSLQAALHAAGVRTTITSLWRVEDAAARELMERFYTNLWAADMGPADALWKAKVELRAGGRPLADWGGWVLSGNPD